MARHRFLLPLLILSFLALSVSSCFAVDPAPAFSLRTTSGETFDNASLKGRLVLVQFWTTWCPYCRRDQPIVDRVENEVASQGLVVLAVNVREPEETVREYLQRSPRACRIVLDPDAAIARNFGARGFPYYFLIDRDGAVVGTHAGYAGSSGLHRLLKLAGLTTSGEESSPRETPAAPTSRASREAPKVIEVPRSKSTPVPQSKQATVFVLKSGERIETMEYVLSATTLQINVGGQRRSIPLSAIDLNASIAVNRTRGIELKVPTNPNEVTL